MCDFYEVVKNSFATFLQMYDFYEVDLMTSERSHICSGTTKHYISRIENNHADIELGTLQKIVEIGLGKQLEV